MDSHDLSSFGSNLKPYMSEATMTWYVHHEFSDRRCDTVCIWYNDNFLARGWNKNKTDMTQISVDICKLSTMYLYHLIQPHSVND